MPEEKLAGLGAVVLERRDADARTSSMVDGIVFFPLSGFRYVRRQDGDHVLVVNVSGGRKPQVVDRESEGTYRRMIAQNHLQRRRAPGGIIIYCATGVRYVFHGTGTKGQMELRVRDELEEKGLAPFMKTFPGR